MISVDKPMPKDCTECPMMYDYVYCNAAEEGFCEKDFDICEADHRPDWCPLVESGPVVRCRNCVQWDESDSVMGRCWCDLHMKSTRPDYFCADGVAKKDATD